ncbi:MAG: hypothetical protein Q4A96_02790 [Candidatus Saccharibacteria bacterium]|nr:hypothetical protein [Candidatus Saccharibacteria bacterium]
MKNTLEIYKQVLDFYKALIELRKILPATYFGDNDVPKGSVPDWDEAPNTSNTLKGISLSELCEQFWLDDPEGSFWTLESGFKRITSLCDYRKEKVTSTRGVKSTAAKFRKVYKACRSFNPDPIIGKALYNEFPNREHHICLGCREDIDKVIDVVKLAMGKALLDLFNDPANSLEYAKLISVLESCPDSAGIEFARAHSEVLGAQV